MITLPKVSDRPSINYSYFPTHWQAVLWRNLPMIPIDRIAKVLSTDAKTLRREAEAMGLDGAQTPDPRWLTRGYLTAIRENFHLLSFDQICTLLDITPDYLAFLLKEDDFLWHKMGQIKSSVVAPPYAPLTAEQQMQTAEIAKHLDDCLPGHKAWRENAFDFVDTYQRPLSTEEQSFAPAANRHAGLRTVYSYFALYGDPLIQPELDPFPDALLLEYAKAGVNGIWLQGILYQLVMFPFAPEMSVGREKRIETLNALIQRAARYGIGVYLYLNEPRAMDDAFFSRFPVLRGTREGDFYALCTSQPDVQQYLECGMEQLFAEAKGLAGFFTITMSENLTNCYSRSDDSLRCPRCAKRPAMAVVTEVNNLMARGMRRAAPDAKAIVWTWAWGDNWTQGLTEGQIVQSTSEEDLETFVGGVAGHVLDYSISQVGPGKKARRVWSSALQQGLETSAKVQVNNTWELSALPYIPVFDKIAAHIGNLKKAGVQHLQLSWTLGGSPSPNLKLACALMDGDLDTLSFLQEWLGDADGETAERAQKMLSRAFSAFPFHIGTVYTAPMNFGPMAPFFMEPTGWKATMIGFPYDDLDTWRAIYPAGIFAAQFEKLVAQWAEGVALLQSCKGHSPAADELLRMAEAALCHFRSTRNHIAFVMHRGQDAAKALDAVRDERENVLRLIALRRDDSRLGYEASNHYFYTLHDLYEKLINLRHCEAALSGI